MTLIYKPTPRKSASMTFTMPPEMHAAISDAASAAKVSASEAVRCAVSRGLPLYMDALRKSQKSGGKSSGKTVGKPNGKRARERGGKAK